MSPQKDNGDGRRELLIDTVEPSATVPPLDPGLVPTLTILLHPDVRRVGERARLYRLRPGRKIPLSRMEPEFAPPGAGVGTPLMDPAISRRPLWIAADEGGRITLDPSETGSRISVDGASLDDPRQFDLGVLERGVVIEVARRVVLLLHESDPRIQRSEGTDRDTFVGDNDAIERIRGEVTSVAATDVPVLLRGETGTGKELIAHALHAASGRADRPFVSVNMAAIPPTTAASALFGHVRGAFTSALRDHAGFFQQADGGTLFLDEVGDTPAEVQVMLLRVLETGEVQRLGAQRTERVDVRLIAATDTDLEAATREGAFRAPLLHRLSAYELVAPPLRERRDDIARLLLHFLRMELREVGEEHRLDPPPPGERPWLSVSLVARLLGYDWPGNVRQLHNFVRQLVIANRGAPRAEARDLFARLLKGGGPPGEASSSAPAGGLPAAPIRTKLETPSDQPGPRAGRKAPAELDEGELVAALRRNRWRPGPAARELGISRTSLYGLIDRSERIRKARDIPQDELERQLEACAGDADLVAERLEVSPRGLKLRLRELGLVR